MEWKIADDRPIWMQLSEQIAAQIAAGVYSVGERLPSVRALAADAGVNPNTMQRAMADLENQGCADRCDHDAGERKDHRSSGAQRVGKDHAYQIGQRPFNAGHRLYKNRRGGAGRPHQIHYLLSARPDVLCRLDAGGRPGEAVRGFLQGFSQGDC